ncbi:hypothetical protein OS31_02680 [Dickeya oryzae]
MKPEVILYKKIPDDLRQKLEQHASVSVFDGLPPIDHPLLARAEGLIGAGHTVSREYLSHLPKLRAVSTVSVGYDNIDVAALNDKKSVADAYADCPDRNGGGYRHDLDADDGSPGVEIRRARESR